ncbi:GNAT family N-acetyltransferase [Psychrobacillus vulpis]|uniref:GNAT family N-acetyltransferase n=1 Tax=Psychrobacillus vulpis TaxID=2325572 RepID=A0A544TNJ4_9BACI|nr:GNAT family N-acetyltransferase [Psychrobacillus vulpis]TQR19014.1 GNAT family N-acetyltransferase [Psychrobacillus vulpis]
MLVNEQQELLNKDGFFISTDKSLLDVEVIHNFLSKESYWLTGVSKELIVASIDNSIICYGIYDGNPTTGSPKQIGFARVVSDLVRYSWLGDVFILPDYRGRGLSKWLMGIITEHPKLKGTSFHLGTRDAHSLYAQFGFKPLEWIENSMARPLNWDAINEGYNLSNKK